MHARPAQKGPVANSVKRHCGSPRFNQPVVSLSGKGLKTYVRSTQRVPSAQLWKTTLVKPSFK